MKTYQVEMSFLADELLTRAHDEEHRGSAKVTVVGTGQVGMAAAFAMMTQVAEIYTPYIHSLIYSLELVAIEACNSSFLLIIMSITFVFTSR